MMYHYEIYKDKDVVWQFIYKSKNAEEAYIAGQAYLTHYLRNEQLFYPETPINKNQYEILFQLVDEHLTSLEKRGQAYGLLLKKAEV